MSDPKSAILVLEGIPEVKTLRASPHASLPKESSSTFFPAWARKSYPYSEALYRQRHKVENLFARLKDGKMHRHILRSIQTHLLPGNLHRCYRHLLALLNRSWP